MNHHESFPGVQHESLSEHHGTIEITDAERSVLNAELEQTFSPHPTFQGVEIKPIEASKLPLAVQELIQKIHGTITTFTAVRIQTEIPVHVHKTDGEIYFGGNNGTVTLFDDSKQEIGLFDLTDHTFTLTTIGEFHGVKASDANGAILFGVKFNQDRQHD